MKLQLFLHDDIALHFYYSKDSVIDGRVVVDNVVAVFPGLPQIIDDDFFADKVNKSTAYFSVYYPGSWLSGGSFTYGNCKKAITTAVEFIKGGRGVKTFDNEEIDWKYTNLHLMGYSFSGNPLVLSNVSKNDVKSVVLFAPLMFLYRDDVSGFMDNDDMDKFYGFNEFYLNFLKRGYRFALRGIDDSSWDSYFSGKNSQSMVSLGSDFPDVVIYHGRNDEKVSHESSLLFKQEKCKTATVMVVDNVGHDLGALFEVAKTNSLFI